MQEFINLSKPILITGETGTGKSVLAKKIFQESNIYKNKFIILNLATIKADLLESELFGHRKGSFTGAVENKIGYFQEASGGTLFLDEIGELSLELQKKLLMVLEEGFFVPVGDTKPIKVNCRLILATNKKLNEEVKKGKFREDLYYRINRFPIEIPSLREIENKKITILNYIEKEFKGVIENDLLMFLLSYSFPGNWRELRNILDYLIFKNPNELKICHLPKYIFEQEAKDNTVCMSLNYEQAFEQFERMYLENQLKVRGGRVVETAKQIGLSKAALIYKSKKYGIDTLKMRANYREIQQAVAA